MAWSVSWDGDAMTVVVALKLSAHTRNITQWFRSRKRSSGEWSPLALERTSGNFHPLNANESRALYRTAQKEFRNAIKAIDQGVLSSL